MIKPLFKISSRSDEAPLFKIVSWILIISKFFFQLQAELKKNLKEKGGKQAGHSCWHTCESLTPVTD